MKAMLNEMNERSEINEMYMQYVHGNVAKLHFLHIIF
jgi:hypothetical protein